MNMLFGVYKAEKASMVEKFTAIEKVMNMIKGNYFLGLNK